MRRAHRPADGPWRDLHPREVPQLLAPVRSPWWIAGGWALDLFVGTQTRKHGDLDVGILRCDVPQVLESMPGWEFFEAKDGHLNRLRRGVPNLEVHSLWSRPLGQEAWMLELMLDESEGDAWVFRRERSVRRALDSAIAHTTEGIPYLVPEIELLYKANRLRPRDDADFHRVLPCLDTHARSWLRDALARLDVHHAWRSALSAAAPAD